MRWNENEVAALAHQPPEWEGRLMHKAQQHGRSAMSRSHFRLSLTVKSGKLLTTFCFKNISYIQIYKLYTK